MRSKGRSALLLILMLAAITALHYFTAHYRLQLHEFYRRLYYLPIIYAAFKFYLRGGVLVSIIAAFLYAPHLMFYIGDLPWEILNQLMEIVLFLVIGVVTGWLMERQIRQQRTMERQLERITDLENYTHNILQSMANGLAALDKDLRLTVFNQALGQWLNLTTESKGLAFFDCFPEAKSLKPVFQRVLRTGKGALGLEVTYRDGENELPLRLAIHPLHNVHKMVSGLVVIVEDIREVRALEEEVRRAERLSAVGVMASGIAHEIRNPLGIIKTVSQNMQEDGCSCSPVNDQGLRIIDEEISRANNVISELLDFARPSPYKWDEVDLLELAQDVVTLTRSFAANSNVKLDVNGRSALVRGDREKLKQALVNMVFNATQAQPQGGRVEISVKTGDIVELIIEDWGKGFDTETAQRIFDPFFTTRGDGTGLGLAVTHRIVQEHQGKIRVSSEPGKGSTFVIQLSPLGKDEGHG